LVGCESYVVIDRLCFCVGLVDLNIQTEQQTH
jgi:hypothetical protein